MVREVWVQAYNVEADSIENAIEKVGNGDCDIIEWELDYSHSLEPETWEVEELTKTNENVKIRK